MGGLFSAPAPPAPPPPPPLAIEDPDKDRQDQLKRRRRGRVGTIETSQRGVLQPRDQGLRRKSLLGE
jgi:hypothetical protein